MNRFVGIKALALAFPRQVRTNDYFREKCADVLAAAEQKSLNKVWSPQAGDAPAPVDHFNDTMRPYLGDPFRGTVERRVVAPGESGLQLETRAVKEALALAGMTPGDVDLLVVSSFVPEDPGLGNAPFIARDLGMGGAQAFNIESACSGSLVSLQTAIAMVQSGQYRNAVVAISCTYSRHTDERDSLGWTCGDGAAAYVVGPVEEGYGWLGGKLRHTGETCEALYYTIADEEPPERKVQLRSAPTAGKALKVSSEFSLRTCVHGALNSAGVKLSEIDFFVFNTPLAWYTEFCSRTLGIPIEKTINTYRWYANTGPALMPTNLFHAAKSGKLKKGDKVLLYTIGSISSAGAAVVRWGDVALGEDPQAARPAAEVPRLEAA